MQASRVGRDLAIAGFLVALLAAVATISTPGRSESGGHPGSSYVPASDGSKALYLLLRSLGHRVQRVNAPLGDLGGARLAFILSPEIALPGADLPGLRGWVERGGTLVYGAGEREP